MANKLTTAEVERLFPGALAALELEDGEDPEEDGEAEFWDHDGTLFQRCWWTAYGWHYGEWTAEHGWVCPDGGECCCPWDPTDSH